MATKNEILNGLSGVQRELKALEEKARKLANQNLADVIATALGKLKPIGDHPDLDAVADADETPPFVPPPADTPPGSVNPAPFVPSAETPPTPQE